MLELFELLSIAFCPIQKTQNFTARITPDSVVVDFDEDTKLAYSRDFDYLTIIRNGEVVHRDQIEDITLKEFLLILYHKYNKSYEEKTA